MSLIAQGMMIEPWAASVPGGVAIMSVPKLELEDIEEKIQSGLIFLIRVALNKLRLYPQDDPVVIEMTGRAYGFLGKFDVAMEWFVCGLANTGDPIFSYHIAATLFFQGKFEEGINVIAKLIESRVPIFRAYVLMISMLEARDDFEAALAVCDVGLSISEMPGHEQDFKIFKAHELALLGKEDEAKKLALESASIILNRNLSAFSEIGTDLSVYFKSRQITNLHRKAFSDLFRYWAGEEQSLVPGPAPQVSLDTAERLQQLRKVYDERVKPLQIDEGDPRELARVDAAVFEYMAPYRQVANQSMQ